MEQMGLSGKVNEWLGDSVNPPPEESLPALESPLAANFL
jgi:hypothetical protein